tara:strand:- start:1999 stop:3048 length:1050 start_codon:yes stop_codon:yes gene_type:complete
MKVAVVGTVGLPACYGGWETLVDNIVKSKNHHVEYTVYCSSKNYTAKLETYNEAKLVYLPFSANGISSIFYDVLSLIHTWFTRPKVVLILGVSGCFFIPLYKVFSNSKVIVNVDGIEWKRDKWGRFAKSFLKFSEAIAVKFSDVIVADNQGISDYLKLEYGKSAEIIAYGGEHAIVLDEISSNSQFYFTVCRVEPENNVEMILSAFSSNNLNYKIVGNWQASSYGTELKAKYSQFKNIELIEPVYDLKVLFQYRNACKGYIHGHSVGGTNPSLVEIMHFGKQVFAYDCSFNRYTTEDQAVYFDSAEELNLALASNSEVSNNPNLKEIALRRYTWDVITKDYESMYENPY